MNQNINSEKKLIAGAIFAANALYLFFLLMLVFMPQSDLPIYLRDHARLDDTLKAERMAMGVFLVFSLFFIWILIIKTYLKVFPQDSKLLNGISQIMRLCILGLFVSILIHAAFYYYLKNPDLSYELTSANQLDLTVLIKYIPISGIAIVITLVATFIAEKDLQMQLHYLSRKRSPKLFNWYIEKRRFLLWPRKNLIRQSTRF
jgi:hypothetical protein